MKKRQHSLIRVLPISLMTILMVSCGGGGGSEDPVIPPQDSSIFVNAGNDISANEQTEVVLTGEAVSTDEALTYSWRSEPSLSITHEDTSTPEASFTAPSVTTETIYQLTLTARNDAGVTGDDSLSLTVLPVNEPPVARITLPSIDNITAGNWPAGTEIVLSGATSTDSDPIDPAQPISSWSWQQIAGGDVIGSNPTDESTLTVFTQVLNEDEEIVIRLDVTDGEGAVSETEITVNQLSASKTPPLVNAGLNQYLFSGETLVLGGQVSSPVATALPLQIDWEANSDVVIDDTSSADTFAVVNEVDSETQVEVTLNVVDQFGNQVSDSLFVTISPVFIPLVNDTGVVLQGTTTSISASQQNTYPGQDGQRGLDTIASQGFIQKAGRGNLGFDYTPLNENGDEIDDLSGTWQCVRDNTTGLVWEVKTDDGTIYDTDNTYSWYLSENDGGFEGDLNGAQTQCTLPECNTEAYITAANTAGVCGFFDWRLPSHEELMSIVDFGATGQAKIDTTYFPNVGTSSNGRIWYWTSQPGADGVSDEVAQNAWAMDFQTGVDNFLNKSSAAKIRLVRAGR